MFNITTYVLKPAYGRHYNSVEDLLAAWESNKDFIVEEGPDFVGSYANKSDMEKYGKVNTSVILESYSPHGHLVTAKVDVMHIVDEEV